MELELEESNFDMMILHYLGVDHVHGPKHPLIPVKLKEMNLVVEKIFKKLQSQLGQAQNEGNEENLPHLILITGDHGMANQGGHGGDSEPEVTTPLVLLTVCPNLRTAVRKLGSNEDFKSIW